MWAMAKWITDSILNAIGKTNDSGGSATAGSATAKLNKLLSDWTTTRAGYIDYLANGSYGLSALSAKIGGITAGSVPVVKSVQRGEHAGAASGNNITISISSVNASKCHIEIYPEFITHYPGATSNNVIRYSFPRPVSLSSTVLTVSRSARGILNSGQWYYEEQIPFSWEITEYY